MSPVRTASTDPNHFASVALDRFFRLHTTYPLPADVKDRPNVEKRSELEKTPIKVFMKSTPTAVVWDGVLDNVNDVSVPLGGNDEDLEEDEDEDWDEMDVVADEVGSSDSESESGAEEPASVRPKRAS